MAVPPRRLPRLTRVPLRRYALDVNAERADDVVTHQRLLEEARDPERRPALSVRVVQVRNPLLTHRIRIHCHHMQACIVACPTRVVLHYLLLDLVQESMHRLPSSVHTE